MESISLHILLTVIFFTSRSVQSVGEELFSYPEERVSQYFDIEWCYNKRSSSCGESTWGNKCNHGTSQSPINLPGNFTKLRSKKGTDNPFESIRNFPRSSYILQGFKMEFTGKTLQINPLYEEDSTRLSFRWVNHDENVTYIFHSFHLHWGSKNDIGSEHTIDGRSFSAEVHLVYFDNRWGSMLNALTSNYKNSVLVIAVFLHVDGDIHTRNRTYDEDDTATYFVLPVVQNLDTLRVGKSYAEFVWLNLAELFEGSEAYSYLGSLTTPKCTENVVWVVMRKPVLFPAAHMKTLRETRFENGGKLVNNFRSLKPRWKGRQRKRSLDVDSIRKEINIVKFEYS